MPSQQKYFVGYNPQGQICISQSSPRGEQPLFDTLECLEVNNDDFIKIAQSVGSPTYYVVAGKIHTAPVRPSHSHDWDWTTKTWVPNHVDAREKQRAAVAQEFARRSVAPIQYTDSLFDADAIARERITGTLSRLIRGEGFPTGWIGWRDYDNAMHWSADTPEQVQTHLAGLAAAIEDREQALLVAMWQHKETLKSLATVEEILAYPINSNWPE